MNGDVMQPLILRILPFALASLVLAACEEEPPPVAEQIRAIKTITVTQLATGQERKYSGIVQATDSSSLSFQVSGNVKSVAVERGERVTKGQVLATLDSKPYELNVQAAQAELGKARAVQAEKKLEYVRQKTLYDKGWVAKAALDQALAAYDSARSQVNYAMSQLNLAKRDLGNTKLVAPFVGLIAERSVDPFVEVSTGQKLFEINAEGAIEVAFDIPETTIARITLGMPVGVTFSTNLDCLCTGRITEIGSVAGDANAFPVKAGLIDPPESVRAGMTAQVSIVLESERVETAYLLPLSAIAPGTETRQGFVFIFDPDTSTVRKTLVRGQGATENMIAIHEGVKAGDVIAVAGVSFLTDGPTVKLMAR